MKKIKILFATFCLLLVATTIIHPTLVVRAEPQSQQPAPPPPPPPPDIDWVALALILIHW